MTDQNPSPFDITDHEQLNEAFTHCEIRAKTPVVDEEGTCLDFVLVPMHSDQAHEMLRAALRHEVYNMRLRAQYANDGEELHLEIVSRK